MHTAPRPRPFTVAIPPAQLTDLKARLGASRFPDKETVDDWNQGVPLSYARQLAAYWHSDEDWRRCETQLAQGGDWGAAVTCAIAAQNAGTCAGIHLNVVIGRPDPALLGAAALSQYCVLE